MLRTWIFLLLVFFNNPSLSKEKSMDHLYGQWHTTHSLEKFPCMNSDEVGYFTRLINMRKNEEKIKILSEHRQKARPGKRMLASVDFKDLTKSNFICPPFRGVRNPHPQIVEFGKASTFEHIRLSDSKMKILNGLSKNEQWDIHFAKSKGYFEGKTPKGTPTNIIPLSPPAGESVRFVVQYLIWQDKTPPSLTLCYREDLHKQCNPYPKPEK